MASTSASTAGNLPEWRLNLIAVPPAERCCSQKALVRGLQLADQILAADPNNLPDYDSSEGLRLHLARLEIGFLTFAASATIFETLPRPSIDKIDDISDYYNEIFKRRINNFMRRAEPVPLTTKEHLYAFVADVSSAITSGLSYTTVFGCADDCPEEVARPIAATVHRFGRYWPQLKALNADSVLAEHGSNITIADLEVVALGLQLTLAGSLLKNRPIDFDAAADWLDDAQKWIEKLPQRPSEIHHNIFYNLSQALTGSEGKVTGSALNAAHDRSLTSVGHRIYSKHERHFAVNRRFLKSYLEGAKALNDPALVSLASLSLAMQSIMSTGGCITRLSNWLMKRRNAS